jgi:hypothetical protein
MKCKFFASIEGHPESGSTNPSLILCGAGSERQSAGVPQLCGEAQRDAQQVILQADHQSIITSLNIIISFFCSGEPKNHFVLTTQQGICTKYVCIRKTGSNEYWFRDHYLDSNCSKMILLLL